MVCTLPRDGRVIPLMVPDETSASAWVENGVVNVDRFTATVGELYRFDDKYNC